MSESHVIPLVPDTYAYLFMVQKHCFVAGGADMWVRLFDFETGAELECHKVRQMKLMLCTRA